MKQKLPEDFFLGASLSGPQTEGAYRTGGRIPSIWDTWSDCAISDFYNKVGSYVGNNFYEKYEEDIKLLKVLVWILFGLRYSGVGFWMRRRS